MCKNRPATQFSTVYLCLSVTIVLFVVFRPQAVHFGTCLPYGARKWKSEFPFPTEWWQQNDKQNSPRVQNHTTCSPAEAHYRFGNLIHDRPLGNKRGGQGNHAAFKVTQKTRSDRSDKINCVSYMKQGCTAFIAHNVTESINIAVLPSFSN